MREAEPKKILLEAGAREEDLDSLVTYTQNRFGTCPIEQDYQNDAYLERWEPVVETSRKEGPAAAINRYLVGKNTIAFLEPDRIQLYLYASAAGTIPVILAKNDSDFANIIIEAIYKGKVKGDVSKIGAMFAFGRKNRFIVLSAKPYSNVPASEMELEEASWRERSHIIRREHECTHYYTKRYLGSSQNNLHDELVADFMGYHKAFGAYKGEWFLRALGIGADKRSSAEGRFGVYTGGLTETGAQIIRTIATEAARALERWSNSAEFGALTAEQRIRRLCAKSLLEYLK